MKLVKLTLCLTLLSFGTGAQAHAVPASAYEGTWLLMKPRPQSQEDLAITFEGNMLFVHRCGRAYGYRILSLKPLVTEPFGDQRCERPETPAEKILTGLIAGKPKLAQQNQGRELKLEVAPDNAAVFLRDTVFVD